MDSSHSFTSVMAAVPATSPPNSSLDNVNQTSSSSPRSPPLPPHSQVASVFILLVVTVIILGTVVGNVLVVVAVFTSRALRAPQNLFLVSLASADILVATLVIPFSLANEVRAQFVQTPLMLSKLNVQIQVRKVLSCLQSTSVDGGSNWRCKCCLHIWKKNDTES